ncbi:PD-(D/E)XK motif protein [Candidatus Poseidonia sp.]|nr:PD-(D/E)XK motif protein [Poseidonia sp.]
MSKKLTKDLIDKIGESVNGQIQKLKQGDIPIQVVLFKTPDFLIQTTDKLHIITIKNYGELKDIETPDWLKITSGTDTIITAPHDRTTEIAYLLRKSYEDHTSDTSQPFTNSIHSKLKIITKWWRGEGEPLTEIVQKGLLGELYAMNELVSTKSEEAISSWDHTSRAAVDFEHAEWSLESKSKAKGADSVRISSKKQLMHQGKPLLLSVLDVSKNKKGKSLPQLVEKLMTDIEAKGIAKSDIESLRKKIDDEYCVFKYEGSFVSKWKVGELKFYVVEETSEPAQFSKNMPDSIDVPRGYDLGLTAVNSISLEKGLSA